MPGVRAVNWDARAADGFLRLLDQTLLPGSVAYRDCRTPEDVREAIVQLRVRGAPAIGVAAAYALVLWAQQEARLNHTRGIVGVHHDLLGSRPTAVNLGWALQRMGRHWSRWRREHGDLPGWMLQEADALAAEDEAMCAAIGRHGAGLIRDGAGVLTHCNTGALATAGIGTALAVLFTAH